MSLLNLMLVVPISSLYRRCYILDSVTTSLSNCLEFGNQEKVCAHRIFHVYPFILSSQLSPQLTDRTLGSAQLYASSGIAYYVSLLFRVSHWVLRFKTIL